MVMSLALQPMEFIILNSYDLLENLAMLLFLHTRNKILTEKHLKQGYQYHKIRKKNYIYRRYNDLISKFHIELKSLLRLGLSELEFFGGLVYKLKKIVDTNNFLCS